MAEILHLKRKILSVNVADISEPEFAVRIHYNQSEIKQLAESLTSNGMFTPLLVKELGNKKYEVHAGSRRLRAAILKGYKEVPAFAVTLNTTAEAVMLALTENLQRQDLDPFEEARSFLYLTRDHHMKLKDIAKEVAKSEPYVRGRIRLLSLPDSVQESIVNRKLGLHFIPTLVGLSSGIEQAHYAEKVLSKNLTLDELKEVIRMDKGSDLQLLRGKLNGTKVIARSETFKRWVRNMPSKLRLKDMDAEERNEIVEALRDLETVIRSTREILTPFTPNPLHVSPSLSGNLDFPDNHGEEWTTSDLTLICAGDRPSDEELSKQLGRSVPAIQAMRSKAS